MLAQAQNHLVYIGNMNTKEFHRESDEGDLATQENRPTTRNYFTFGRFYFYLQIKNNILSLHNLMEKKKSIVKH
jgi:hypothetical protein